MVKLIKDNWSKTDQKIAFLVWKSDIYKNPHTVKELIELVKFYRRHIRSFWISDITGIQKWEAECLVDWWHSKSTEETWKLSKQQSIMLVMLYHISPTK